MFLSHTIYLIFFADELTLTCLPLKFIFPLSLASICSHLLLTWHLKGFILSEVQCYWWLSSCTFTDLPFHYWQSIIFCSCKWPLLLLTYHLWWYSSFLMKKPLQFRLSQFFSLNNCWFVHPNKWPLHIFPSELSCYEISRLDTFVMSWATS